MENQIYELMAQAEILQEHALEIQNGAVKTISGIPEAVEDATEKIRSTALWAAIIFLVFGLLTTCGIVLGLYWSTDGLREEKRGLQHQIEDLKNAVQAEKISLEEIRSKKWGIELGERNGQRWLKLGKEYEVGKAIEWKKDGREGIEINLKK